MTFSETHLLVQAVRCLCAISRERLSVERPQSQTIPAHITTGTPSRSRQHNPLAKTKVEVSIFFYPEWPAVFLHLPVGRTIRQNIEQPRMEFGVATVDRTISASVSLAEVANWNGESQDIGRILITAFGAEDYLDCIKNLQARDIDPLSYINNLDKV